MSRLAVLRSWALLPGRRGGEAGSRMSGLESSCLPRWVAGRSGDRESPYHHLLSDLVGHPGHNWLPLEGSEGIRWGETQARSQGKVGKSWGYREVKPPRGWPGQGSWVGVFTPVTTCSCPHCVQLFLLDAHTWLTLLVILWKVSTGYNKTWVLK